MQPGTDLTRLQSVILMASPVQLIRTVGNDIKLFVTDIKTLATLSAPLAIPSETLDGQKISCARQFISVVGNQDPLGGFLLGNKQSFAFMSLKGQREVIDDQELIGVDKTAVSMRLRLACALAAHLVAKCGPLQRSRLCRHAA